MIHINSAVKAGYAMEFNFLKKRNSYVESSGPINYLDDSGLTRPFVMPKSQVALMGIFIILAVAIGSYLLFHTVDSIQGKAARDQAALEQNLSRQVAYDLPLLPAIIEIEDNEALKQSFIEAGNTVYDATHEEEALAGNLRIVKLPPDMSELDAAVMLEGKGINGLDAANAARLLNGSWTLDVNRSEGLSMRVTYTDFTSHTIETAIQNALATEGFDPAASVDDAGVDEAGNTFQTGIVTVNDTEYTWKISAIALSDVYDISGLPEDAVYVGIRLTL